MDEYTPTTDEVRAYASTHGRMPPEWFDRWLAARDRVVAANAWDEGSTATLDAVIADRGYGAPDYPPNPYRITEENN